MPLTTYKLSRPHLLFSALLILAGLRPYPRAALGLPAFERLSDLILFFFVVLLLVYYLYYNGWRLGLSDHSKVVLQLFGLLIVLSSISLLLSPVQILTDSLEIARFVMYLGLFFAGLILNWRPRQIAVYIITPLLAITALQIPLALGHYFGFDIVMRILQWYTYESNLQKTRSVGMFFNPYTLGVFLILPFAYYIHRLVSVHNTKSQAVSITTIIFLLISILLTQSRSATIVLIGAMVYMGIVLSVASRSLFKRYALASGVVFTISAFSILLYLDLGYLTSGLRLILEGELQNVTSAEMRFKKYEYMISLASERPLIGWGPAKTLIDNPENNYLMYLYRYGISGITIFLAMFSAFTLRTFKVYWYNEKYLGGKTTSFYFSFHIWMVALLAGSFSNSFISDPRIYPFLFLFLGVVYSVTKD